MPDSNHPFSVEEPCPVGPGDTLSSRYTLEHLVGEGTFGWVFSAVDVLESPPRRVAIKLLRQRYSTQDEVVRRFERRELALLLRVQELAPTPHVVRAQEPRVLVHEGHPYLVLEFIEGPSLREAMDTRPLTGADVQRWGVELARGLAAIHSAGGVHRDLKPTNIRLRGGTQPVIVDLGINRALWDTQEFTGTGQSLMTPRYASPEQGLRLDVGPESDVYSLGLILYELLTGDVPLPGEDIHAALDAGQRGGTAICPDARFPIPRALISSMFLAWIACSSSRPAWCDLIDSSCSAICFSSWLTSCLWLPASVEARSRACTASSSRDRVEVWDCSSSATLAAFVSMSDL